MSCTHPLPPGNYVLYDLKERRGWWVGVGYYSIWPNRARIYTAAELNAMPTVFDYVECFPARDLALSCSDFVQGALIVGS